MCSISYLCHASILNTAGTRADTRNVFFSAQFTRYLNGFMTDCSERRLLASYDLFEKRNAINRIFRARAAADGIENA